MTIKIEENDLYIEKFLYDGEEHELVLLKKNKAFNKGFLDFLKSEGIIKEL